MSHFAEGLNSKFTVLKNSKFQRYFANRINCTAIVRPYGDDMVTVLRTPARPNVNLTSHVCIWSYL
jgi:hypothetical protein